MGFKDLQETARREEKRRGRRAISDEEAFFQLYNVMILP